jgi:hypothetical protein
VSAVFCSGRTSGAERDGDNSYLAGDAVDGGSMDQLLGHSITYRIAVEPQASLFD